MTNEPIQESPAVAPTDVPKRAQRWSPSYSERGGVGLVMTANDNGCWVKDADVIPLELKVATLEDRLSKQVCDSNAYRTREDLRHLQVDLDSLVDRFLAWELPADFNPDRFISFDRSLVNQAHDWPTGTNLFTAEQARQMFKYLFAVCTAHTMDEVLAKNEQMKARVAELEVALRKAGETIQEQLDWRLAEDLRRKP